MVAAAESPIAHVMPRAIDASSPEATDEAKATFRAFYNEHFSFVWRSACRFGVGPGAVDDVVQETFVLAHAKFETFRGESSIKTWLFAIMVNVARGRRREHGRREQRERDAGESSIATAPEDPFESLARREAVAILERVLAELDDDRRTVFVLIELEQVAPIDVATSLGINVNTVHSRLRAARTDFESALARVRARDAWRLR